MTGSTIQAPRGRDRIDEIDAIRAVAALSVVVFHARAEFWVGVSELYSRHGFAFNLNSVLGFASYPFSFGWLGVQVFFVVSGYCIHRKNGLALARYVNFTPDWKDFFLRRILRIYPVYIVALLGTAVVGYLYTANNGEIIGGELSWRAFIYSLLTLQGIAAPVYGTNTVFWTLSIEMHLYLFYPVLYICDRKFGALATLFFAASISIAYAIVTLIIGNENLFPYAHGGGPIFIPFVFMWFGGAYLADVEAGRAPALTGIAWNCLWPALLISGIFINMRFGEVASAIPLALGCVGLVNFSRLVIRHLAGQAQWLLGPLSIIGLCSYSLYATHRIVFGLVNVSGFAGQSEGVLKLILVVILSFVCAWIFYWLIERNAVRVSHWVRDRNHAAQ